MAQPDVLGKLDEIAYDAPLNFPPPSKAWTEAKGGRANNRTDKLLYGEHVPIVDLAGKWIIISGSNNGIGKEAAITMASWGANLVLACREPGPGSHESHPAAVVEECRTAARIQGHEKSSIEWWSIDMADLSTVEAFADRWLITERPLDVLCNNAGVGSSRGGSKEIFLTKDGFEFVHQINLLSHVLLTMKLLPSLAKSTAPRIVCTTSCFHYLGNYDISNFNGGANIAGGEGVGYYKNNKLYFQIWLNELQHRLLQHKPYKHIVVNGFHPGYVASGIWVANRKTWLTGWLSWVLILVARFFGIDTKQGSMALVFLATSPEAGTKGARYFNRIWEEEGMPHCKDTDARCRIWRKVAEELDLKAKGLLDVVGLYSGQYS